ncbi:MAG: hypothetical protein HYY08_04265 [Firmicutes bacterium]|nr:hypothetical protein [Bacillota bacterium]
MFLETVLPVIFGVLLASNMWILREVDRLKRQLEVYQREVASLDDRVCQLMYDVEEAGRKDMARSM